MTDLAAISKWKNRPASGDAKDRQQVFSSRMISNSLNDSTKPDLSGHVG